MLGAEGAAVGQVHLRHLNPFPKDLGDIMRRFRKVLVPELNLGQLAMLLRARYLIDVVSHTKVRGKPFKESEIVQAVRTLLEGTR